MSVTHDEAVSRDDTRFGASYFGGKWENISWTMFLIRSSRSWEFSPGSTSPAALPRQTNLFDAASIMSISSEPDMCDCASLSAGCALPAGRVSTEYVKGFPAIPSE